MPLPPMTMVNTALRAADVARPALLILHLAPPVTWTSPEPMMLTSAVPVALAAMLPEPRSNVGGLRLDALGVDVARPRDFELGVLGAAAADLGSAEPAMASFSVWTSSVATSRPPEPAISPSNESPLTWSTLMSPDPAIDAPRSCGTDTVRSTLPWKFQPVWNQPFCRSGWISSFPLRTSTTNVRSAFVSLAR